ncbi:MAG: hypothetical protein AAFX54_11670 [Pseudomonadota bacterium]
MRVIGLTMVSALLATNAAAFDATHNTNWALSGVTPVTHMDGQVTADEEPLVLSAAAFETPGAQTPSFATLPAATSASKTAGIMKKTPGAEAIKNRQPATMIFASFETQAEPTIFNPNASASNGELDQLIDEKWRAAEEFYVADFFKAHQ